MSESGLTERCGEAVFGLLEHGMLGGATVGSSGFLTCFRTTLGLPGSEELPGDLCAVQFSWNWAGTVEASLKPHLGSALCPGLWGLNLMHLSRCGTS